MRNSLRMSIAGIIAAALLVAGPALAGKEGKKIEPTEFKLTGKLVKEHMVKKEKNGKVHTTRRSTCRRRRCATRKGIRPAHSTWTSSPATA